MERKTKNISHPYSVVKRYLRIVFAILMCLCMSMPLYAQKITVTYDYAKQTLIINNPNGQPAYLYIDDDMPEDLQAYIQKRTRDNGDTTTDSFIGIQCGDCLKIKIDSSQLSKFDTLTLKVFAGEGNPKKIEKVKIDFLNSPISDNSGQQPSKPFYLDWFSETKKILYSVAGTLTVLILLVVIFLLLKWKKKKTNDGEVVDQHVMQMVEEEKNDYAVGLDYARQHPDQYFIVDMEEFCVDTAVKKVFFSREAIKSINSYYKAFLEQPERTNETGCYLIGGWETVEGNEEQYNISVEEMVIPGDDAVYDEYSLNFGLKIGIKLGSAIRNLCEKTGRDYVHTVWMHSHPGLGLFLSSHDLVVQKQLAYPDAPKRMVAIVIDTNTPNWQMAFFTAKNSGVMNNKEDLRKTISFDVLNEWSRHKTVAVQSSATVENSFIVSTEDARDEFAFSAKTINQIDDAVYAEVPEKGYPLYGEVRQEGSVKTRVITACGVSDDNKEIGWLEVDSDIDEAFDAHRCDEKLAKTDFCLVYRSEQECYVVWQNADRKIRFVHTSLKEMKEWTRRKRV